MTIDLKFFLVGLILLWFPRHWMRRGVALMRQRKRSAESMRITEPWKDREPGDPRVNLLTEIKKFRNYVDLLRAAAGGLMLSGGMGMPAAIAVAADAPRSATLQLMGVRAVILLMAGIIQALRYEKNRISFYPAIFFLAGLTVSLCDYRGAAFAFVLIWAINPALPNAQAFLTVYAILVAVFGHFFGGLGDLWAAFAGFLCFLPVLLSLMAKRPLTAFTRKGSRG